MDRMNLHIKNSKDAYNEFFQRADPYFKMLADVHIRCLKGYLKTDTGLQPLYTETGEFLMKQAYEHIEYIKDMVMKHYKLTEEDRIPTITKPAGW